jgi:hypothetical protein
MSLLIPSSPASRRIASLRALVRVLLLEVLLEVTAIIRLLILKNLSRFIIISASTLPVYLLLIGLKPIKASCIC